jgi:hypothetical protein
LKANHVILLPWYMVSGIDKKPKTKMTIQLRQMQSWAHAFLSLCICTFPLPSRTLSHLPFRALFWTINVMLMLHTSVLPCSFFFKLPHSLFFHARTFVLLVFCARTFTLPVFCICIFSAPDFLHVCVYIHLCVGIVMAHFGNSSSSFG